MCKTWSFFILILSLFLTRYVSQLLLLLLLLHPPPLPPAAPPAPGALRSARLGSDRCFARLNAGRRIPCASGAASARYACWCGHLASHSGASSSSTTATRAQSCWSWNCYWSWSCCRRERIYRKRFFSPFSLKEIFLPLSLFFCSCCDCLTVWCGDWLDWSELDSLELFGTERCFFFSFSHPL